MISSVIARLTLEPESMVRTIREIAEHPALETGELIDNRLLPVIIESEGATEMEHVTRWLQSCEGVEYVDVVFVHFEQDRDDETRGHEVREGDDREGEAPSEPRERSEACTSQQEFES